MYEQILNEQKLVFISKWPAQCCFYVPLDKYLKHFFFLQIHKIFLTFLFSFYAPAS